MALEYLHKKETNTFIKEKYAEILAKVNRDVDDGGTK
jgi:hypothetical protein